MAGFPPMRFLSFPPIGTPPLQRFFAGAAFACAGIVLVEVLVAAGGAPVSPLGWPGLGTVVASALYGALGLAGGASVVLAYLLANLLRPDRFPLYFSGAVTVLTWPAGILFLSALALQLGKRLRQAEQSAALAHALAESEARYRALVSGAPVGIVSVARGGIIRDVNPGFCEIVGYAPEELVGREVRTLAHPDDWPRNEMLAAELEAGARSRYELELRAVRKDGRHAWIRLAASSVPGSDGAPGYRVTVVEDIGARKEAEEGLRRSEAMLRLLSDNIPAFIAYFDREERYVFANRFYEVWLGRTADEIRGRTIRDLWGADRYALARPWIERALAGHAVTFEEAILLSGRRRYFLLNYVPDRDPEGRVRGVFVLGTDVTQLEAARAELRTARGRLEAALDGSKLALWDLDMRSGTVYLSEAWAEIVGGERVAVRATGEELLRMVHPADLEAVKGAALEAVKGRRPAYAIEHRVQAMDGSWRWILSRGQVTERDPATGHALRMVGTNYDITDRKQVEEALQSEAQTDPLTGLANRARLNDRLALALARSQRSGRRTAVLYLDIEYFKQINDSRGHAAGDAMLREFASRLRACVRGTDTVARPGGDEFVIVLEELPEERLADQIAEKLLAKARLPIEADGATVTVTTSIGIALSEGGSTGDELLRAADKALYEAKGAGRDGYRKAS